MKILIYGLNYAPELTGIGKYSGEMAEWLAERGHEVHMVCAPPYYPEWRVADGYKNNGYSCQELNRVKIFRSPLFVPNKPRAATRLIHLLSFAVTSLPVMLRQIAFKPDVVIMVKPTFFCVPAALLVSKLTGAKSLLHIQDFELDAMLGLGLAKFGVFTRFLYAVESFFMRRFDAVSTISNSMVLKAQEKTGDAVPVIFFPNWVDAAHINPQADTALFRRQWNISAETQVVLYSGNLGKKQGLELLIQAARQFSCQDVLFLILGDGVEKLALMEQAKQLDLQNVRFEPLQPYEQLPSLMRLADVHVVIQKRGAADLVMPSKLTTILSAGGYALITAEAETELGLLCQTHPGVAECVEPENLDQFVSALQKMLLEAKSGRATVNQVARDYALRELDKQSVLETFEGVLQKLVRG